MSNSVAPSNQPAEETHLGCLVDGGMSPFQRSMDCARGLRLIRSSTLWAGLPQRHIVRVLSGPSKRVRSRSAGCHWHASSSGTGPGSRRSRRRRHCAYNPPAEACLIGGRWLSRGLSEDCDVRPGKPAFYQGAIGSTCCRVLHQNRLLESPVVHVVWEFHGVRTTKNAPTVDKYGQLRFARVKRKRQSSCLF